MGVYYLDRTGGVGAVVGSSGPVQIVLQTPAAQFAAQTSRLAVMPVVGDPHVPTPPAQVTCLIAIRIIFTAQCTLVQSAILRSHVVRPPVCLSVTLVDCDHIHWKSWKLIARTISQPLCPL